MPHLSLKQSQFRGHLKAATFGLLTLVLIGWVTDALNEALIFKLFLRQFFPQLVASFEHPFESWSHFLLWLFPLLTSLAVMLYFSFKTIHHFKKNHNHLLSTAQHSVNQSVLLCMPPLPFNVKIERHGAQIEISEPTAGSLCAGDLAQARNHMHNRGFTWFPLFDLLHSHTNGFKQLHFFADSAHKEQAQSLAALLKNWLAPECNLTLHTLKNPDDVHAVHAQIAQVCDNLALQNLGERDVLLDVHGASQTYTIAASMASLSCGAHLTRATSSGQRCVHYWMHNSET